MFIIVCFFVFDVTTLQDSMMNE